MRILLAGGSGFIGSALTAHLLEHGANVTIVDLQPPRSGHQPYYQLDLLRSAPDTHLPAGHDAVIQLTGVPINRRWNSAFKQRIYDSRIVATRNLVHALGKLPASPAVFVCASAVGYYGDHGDKRLTESSPPGTDFLARLCQDWEQEARGAVRFGARVVSIRTAPVLGRETAHRGAGGPGGILRQLVPLFRLGLGGPLGSGRQWFPWIHLDDLVRIYTLAATDARCRGAINAAAPDHVRQSEFARALGHALHRPALMRTPRWALRLRFGELADSLTASQRVEPRALTALGYTWKCPSLPEALQSILS